MFFRFCYIQRSKIHISAEVELSVGGLLCMETKVKGT